MKRIIDLNETRTIYFTNHLYTAYENMLSYEIP